MPEQNHELEQTRFSLRTKMLAIPVAALGALSVLTGAVGALDNGPEDCEADEVWRASNMEETGGQCVWLGGGSPTPTTAVPTPTTIEQPPSTTVAPTPQSTTEATQTSSTAAPTTESRPVTTAPQPTAPAPVDTVTPSSIVDADKFSAEEIVQLAVDAIVRSAQLGAEQNSNATGIIQDPEAIVVDQEVSDREDDAMLDVSDTENDSDDVEIATIVSGNDQSPDTISAAESSKGTAAKSGFFAVLGTGALGGAVAFWKKHNDKEDSSRRKVATA